MKFPLMVRQLRTDNRLKQREIAVVVGLQTNSYGNVESTNHKVIGLDRVRRLARFYKLNNDAEAELIAAWDELPQSEYQQRQAKTYEQRKAFRSKARGYDLIRMSLLELVSLLVTSVADPALLCACPAPDLFAEPPDKLVVPDLPCELCNALQLLGLSGWTSLDQVVAELAKVQEAMADE